MTGMIARRRLLVVIPVQRGVGEGKEGIGEMQRRIGGGKQGHEELLEMGLRRDRVEGEAM
jgi:hypothetical protein